MSMRNATVKLFVRARIRLCALDDCSVGCKMQILSNEGTRAAFWCDSCDVMKPELSLEQNSCSETTVNMSELRMIILSVKASVCGAVFVAEPLPEFIWWMPSQLPAANTETRPTDLGSQSTCIGRCRLHLPSPFRMLVSPKAATYCCFMEDGRLSQPDTAC